MKQVVRTFKNPEFSGCCEIYVKAGKEVNSFFLCGTELRYNFLCNAHLLLWTVGSMRAEPQSPEFALSGFHSRYPKYLLNELTNTNWMSEMGRCLECWVSHSFIVKICSIYCIGSGGNIKWLIASSSTTESLLHFKNNF